MSVRLSTKYPPKESCPGYKYPPVIGHAYVDVCQIQTDLSLKGDMGVAELEGFVSSNLSSGSQYTPGIYST